MVTNRVVFTTNFIGFPLKFTRLVNISFTIVIVGVLTIFTVFIHSKFLQSISEITFKHCFELLPKSNLLLRVNLYSDDGNCLSSLCGSKFCRKVFCFIDGLQCVAHFVNNLEAFLFSNAMVA